MEGEQAAQAQRPGARAAALTLVMQQIRFRDDVHAALSGGDARAQLRRDELPLALVLQAAGRPELEPVVLNQASNEIERQFLDCTKARAKLGWTPRYSMQEALKRTVAWYREHEARA